MRSLDKLQLDLNFMDKFYSIIKKIVDICVNEIEKNSDLEISSKIFSVIFNPMCRFYQNDLVCFAFCN